jgi:hypothetical protein
MNQRHLADPVDLDPVAAVPGDDIAGAQRRTADGIEIGAVAHHDAIEPEIEYGGASGDVQSNVIALDPISRGTWSGQDNVAFGISGNDVSRDGDRTADPVVRGIGDGHTDLVAKRRRARGVRPNGIALNNGAGRGDAVNLNTASQIRS